MRSQIKFRLKKTEPTLHFIEPTEKGIPMGKKEASFLAFKRFMRKNIITFFVSMGLLFAGLMCLYSLTHYYRSEVTVSFSGYEIPEYSDQLNSSIPGFAQMKDGMSRLYIMIYSTEMFDHLIKKFDLYRHYGLSETTKNYSALRKILKANINFIQGNTKVLTIRVNDPVSGTMCADIANEIVVKANEMNKKYMTEKMQNRVLLYQKLHDEIRTQTEADIQNLAPQIASLNAVLKNYAMKSPVVEQSAFGLTELTRRIENDIAQLLQISRVNMWSMNSMNEDVMSNVTSVMEALPGEVEDTIPLWILIPGAMVASFVVTLFLFSIYYNYRPYLRLLLS